MSFLLQTQHFHQNANSTNFCLPVFSFAVTAETLQRFEVIGAEIVETSENISLPTECCFPEKLLLLMDYLDVISRVAW